ncbi:MAG: nickel pincer cofactor biosynthesis protein LarC [Bacteroidota bacterium]|nr:nickel pincer cofactor biosynthesis protein LarC [Bacteroidota bacterium]
MRIAYLDTFSGISGDMTLGALVDAGVPFDALVSELRKLPLEGYHIECRRVVRGAISATKIDVRTAEADTAAQSDAHGSHAHHRSCMDILRMIDEAGFAPRVAERAKNMFLAIGRAEARIHDIPIERVRFHEVGAVDSIIDIVGIAVCLELAGVEQLWSSPVRTGSGGIVTTAHGKLPVPTPAALEILRGYPIELTDVPFELVTPTGAAVVAALSSGVLDGMERIVPEAVGYGAGGRDIPGMPNLLRIVLGTMGVRAEDEILEVVETNIDDMNPEIYPWLMECLVDAGASDVFLSAVTMKKGRPGQLVTVLCPPASLERVLDVLYRQTSTTGVRFRSVRRRKLPRDLRVVRTRFGPMTVKEVARPGGMGFVPEYEECRRIAAERGIPLIEVYRQVEQDCARST